MFNSKLRSVPFSSLIFFFVQKKYLVMHKAPPRLQGLKKTAVAPLRDLCIKAACEHFESFPRSLESFPSKDKRIVAKNLDVNVHVEIAAAYISDEIFWKRRAMNEEGWTHFEIAAHGMSWKQFYLEQKLEELLERFSPQDGSVEEEELLSHLRAGQDYVFQLCINQLPSHLDMSIVFEALPNLANLKLTYGPSCFEQRSFGLSLQDAEYLVQGIKHSQILTNLTLSCNSIDDEKFRILAQGLIGSQTVTNLDLSHNKLTSESAEAIRSLVGVRSVLDELNLEDNRLGHNGAAILSRCLKVESSLRSLNLRLNGIGDAAGKIIFDSLAKSGSSLLVDLDLGANELSSQSVMAFCNAFHALPNLEILNFAANEIDEEDASRILLQIGKDKKRLTSIDLRRNKCSLETCEFIKEKLREK